MLLDEHTLLASPLCSSRAQHGEFLFEEDKSPPSRAYLKLWEAFTRMGKWPKIGERVLEIGASPGSWTWVLQQLHADVIAVDRAPLDPLIAKNMKTTFMKRDAFTLTPHDLPPLDWICSDVICYPEKLLSWLEPWLTQKINFVCTLKFQGSDGYAVVKEFEKIEGSEIVHLYHNKHELTFIKKSISSPESPEQIQQHPV